MSKHVCFASVISEIEQSEVFMTVKARILETPAANLNGARVTPAFVDEIVANEKRYVGLPLYADVKALTSGKYTRLGHLYDERTGEFHSTQIGSFYKFEKEDFDEGSYLIGYARIPKRNKKLSKAIAELFSDGALKFSFEIAVGEYDELDDDTILIDASENNYLEGTAIVTFPACEEAVALQLVAQKTDDTQGGEKEMAETNINVEPVQEETASVVVREEHFESVSTSMCDTETGTEVRQNVNINTETIHVEDGNIVETPDGTHIAEEKTEETAEEKSEEVSEVKEDTEEKTEETAEKKVEIAEPDDNQEDGDGSEDEDDSEETEEEEVPTSDNTESKEKTAEEQIRKTAEEQIAELTSLIEEMRQEIAELKEAKMTAEVHTTAEVNPFMADISAGNHNPMLDKVSSMGYRSMLERV